MPNANIYPIPLLNDIHNYLPDILYNQSRFQSVQDLLQYIRDVADPYRRGLSEYNQRPPSNNHIHYPYQTPPQTHQRRSQPESESEEHHQSSRRRLNREQVPSRLETDTSDELISAPPPITRYLYTTSSFPSGSLQALFDLFNDDDTRTMGTTPTSLDTINQWLNQRVTVRPTREQIQNSTTVTGFNRAVHSDNCAICQDPFDDTSMQVRSINYCRHYFHQNCIDTWFSPNVHCPICRHDIRESAN